jgi:hypothetical protein
VSQIGFSTFTNFPRVFIIFYLFFLACKNAFRFIFESKKSYTWGLPVGLSSAARRIRIGRRGRLPPVAVPADIKEGRVPEGPEKTTRWGR